MSQEAVENFAGNDHISADIHELLQAFPEPSKARMRRRLRQHRSQLAAVGSDQADEQARHTFREFLPAHILNRNGFNLEYERTIGNKTPDWFDEGSQLLLEVFTCERGGNSNPVQRMSDRIVEKVGRYRETITAKALFFVIAVHGDFCTGLEADDCKQAISDNQLFERYPELSGVIFFAEDHVSHIQQPNGAMRRKQHYRYTYFGNPAATHKIDLESQRA